MKNISKDNWDCSSVKAVGNFLGDSCVPGILSVKNIDAPRNLYSLCTTGKISLFALYYIIYINIFI